MLFEKELTLGKKLQMAMTAGAPRRLTVTDPLSPDDLECLWAIARRGKNQDKWIAAFGPRLEAMGLVRIESGWPRLTAAGVQALDRAAQDLWMKVSSHELRSRRLPRVRPALVKRIAPEPRNDNLATLRI
jgi:hypothetical protein